MSFYGDRRGELLLSTILSQGLLRFTRPVSRLCEYLGPQLLSVFEFLLC
jgi:hypothetical protein